MSGAAKSIGRVFERSVKSVIHNPVQILPAAVGVATGNPWLAAASAGGISAIRGKSGSEILRDTATVGIGSYVGSSVGGYVGKTLSESGATRQILGMSAGQRIGTGIGAAVSQSARSAQQYRQDLTSVNAPENKTVPTFEEMRQNAVIATRKVFERNNVFGRFPGKYQSALRRSNVPRYGMRLWKDRVKPVKSDGR